MIVSYDMFTEAFLEKVTEHKYLSLSETNRQQLVDHYMKRACAQFSDVCKYDIMNGDNDTRTFNFENAAEWEVDEIIDIVSDGMLVQWMKPYTYKHDNLENVMNTTDFSTYSPAELLHRIVEEYKMCKKEFVSRKREYSYRHGDLTDLHL